MICNGIAFIGFDEIWKPITYKNIVRNMYEASNLGRVRKIKKKKILLGCNPNNEKGYVRVQLKTDNGESKKFPVHRIILHTFEDLDDSFEVNHIDGNKLNNSIYNLEKSTRLENAHHASENGLYEQCERRYNATFTNDEVHSICMLLEEGKSVSYIIKKLGLSDRKHVMSNIDKIINRKSWRTISEQYTFDYNKYHYKTYSYDTIFRMCDCIFGKHMKNKDIIPLFPEYDPKRINTVLKGIRHSRVYKKVINDYMCSTTRERL